MMTPITINPLFQSILALSAADAGQNRLVYTPNWVAAQTQLLQAGVVDDLQARVDQYGNVYLDLPGRLPELPAIATGSHMDTVVNGGALDGLYGIIGGLTAVQRLRHQYGQPKRTLRIIAFSEEEGSRFPATFSGSKYYARRDQVTNLVDATGASFEAARITAVQSLKRIPRVIFQRPDLPATFTELHIEQGPRLIHEHRTIGLVAAIVGQRRFNITVHGVANHAGTTPMVGRIDALTLTTQLLIQLQQAAAQTDPELTYTVGQLAVVPNTANTIPGKVTFSVDFRHPSSTVLDAFETKLTAIVAAANQPQHPVESRRWVSDVPRPLDATMLANNRRIASQLGYHPLTLVSGAGHDSAVMSQVVPTTMLFVPSIGGISHAPTEQTAPDDLTAGVDVLTESLYHQAY